MRTSIAETICRAGRRWGLRLELRDGGRVAVIPGSKAPPEFLELVRQHKPQLLAWLEGQAAGLQPDERPWLHTARQVLAGEFDPVTDGSMREALTIGLRSIQHPVCQQALARLKSQQQEQF